LLVGANAAMVTPVIVGVENAIVDLAVYVDDEFMVRESTVLID
jgi:tetrahydrodipicolinate N-succinyltransferase